MAITVLAVAVCWLLGASLTLGCLALVLGLRMTPLLVIGQRDGRRFMLKVFLTWPRRLPRLIRRLGAGKQSGHQ